MQKDAAHLSSANGGWFVTQNAQVASKLGQQQTLLRIQILFALQSLRLLFSHTPQSAVWIFSNVRFSSGLSAAILPICPEKPVCFLH